MNELPQNNQKGTANIAGDRVLATGHFKCSDCQHKKRYTTGRDEYPALTTMEYCSKEHWEGGDIPSADDIDNWSNCTDFLPCT